MEVVPVPSIFQMIIKISRSGVCFIKYEFKMQELRVISAIWVGRRVGKVL